MRVEFRVLTPNRNSKPNPSPNPNPHPNSNSGIPQLDDFWLKIEYSMGDVSLSFAARRCISH